MKMKRRKFVKTALVGIGAATVGTGVMSHLLKGTPNIAAATHGGPHFELDMTEALVEMIDTRPIYHWAFSSGIPGGVPQMPGPLIEVTDGQTVVISIRNNLLEPHGFAIPGVVFSDPPGATSVTLLPGETGTVTFTATAGSYLYIDPLNEPINRVLGLHGPMVVRPAGAALGHNITPYSNPTANVQQLFDDLGGLVDPNDLTRTTTGGVFPGDPWKESPILPLPQTRDQARALRQRIWLFNEIDPTFNNTVEANGGKLEGTGITPATFKANFLARYFTINGESGAYAADNHGGFPDKPMPTMPEGFIGEPMLIRIMQVGMVAHSLHIHANHVYVLSLNGNVGNVLLDGTGAPLPEVADNLPFVDTFTARPMDRIDWLLPFHRIPDLPGPTNKPVSELIPQELQLVLGQVQQSPLAYPMHDHNEPTQTAAGGNYNQGQVVHFHFLGDLVNIGGQNIKLPFPNV